MSPGPVGHGHLRRRAAVAYGLSVATISAATFLAARRFPDGFDWVYTVMSALASRKHNPEGSVWFAAGISLSLGMLWPALAWVRANEGTTHRLARVGLRTLRAGIVFGVLVGVERLVFFHFSELVRKGHEMLAILCFLNLYTGVLTLLAHRLRRSAGARWATWLTIAPLVAIGLSQLGLYLDQRDLGWVDTGWREMGIPFWLSFAFWQWLAAITLWIGLGFLVLSGAQASRSSLTAVP